MLKKIIAFINTEQWDLDPIQMAEVLWFMHQVSQQEQEQNDSQNLISSSREQTDKNYNKSNDFPDSKIGGSKQQNESISKSSSSQYPLTIPSSNKSQKTEEKSFPKQN